MLTLQTLEKIKNGAKITLFNGIFAVLYGILYLVFLNPIIKSNFRVVDVVWQVFYKYNHEMGAIFVRAIVLKGIFIIALGLAIIYLSSQILKRKEKITWVMLFVIGLIFWPALLTIEILDKNIFTIIAASIGWIAFIIGMVIPLRYYMQREYTEY